MPLSYNRAPCASLQPWIMRIGVTSVSMPDGHAISCGTFSEHPVMRMIYGARWTAVTADGEREFDPGDEGLALYFGPCTRMMPLTAHGSFRVVTINFAPGGTLDLGLPPQEATVDRILPFDPFTGEARPRSGYTPRAKPQDWLLAAEEQLVSACTEVSPKQPNPVLGAFERFCLTDPGASLAGFAETQGMARRTLERIIRRDWGVTPRFALRRAKALDMAAALLDVAQQEEEPEIRLRYFDQSHLIREMRQFFATTPGKMQGAPHPLLRITMEIRQSRRLEALARLGIDEPRPWRDPAAEPGAVSRTES